MSAMYFYLWMNSIATVSAIVLFVLGAVFMACALYNFINYNRNGWQVGVIFVLGFMMIALAIFSPSSTFWAQAYCMEAQDDMCSMTTLYRSGLVGMN